MNTDLFKSVIASNVQTTANAIEAAAERMAALAKTRELTEDQTRHFAVVFFEAEIMRIMYERAKNRAT